MMKISTFFVNFGLIQIQYYSVQIKKMEGRLFDFQLKKKKYFCGKLTDNARYKNVPLSLDLTRILQSYHKWNDIRKFPE